MPVNESISRQNVHNFRFQAHSTIIRTYVPLHYISSVAHLIHSSLSTFKYYLNSLFARANTFLLYKTDGTIIVACLLMGMFSLRRPGLVFRIDHVGSVVVKITLNQFFSEFFGLALLISFHLCPAFTRVSSGAGQWARQRLQLHRDARSNIDTLARSNIVASVARRE